MADDTISRQAAIDETWREPSYTDPLNVLTEIRERLRALPTAERKGHWVEEDDGIIHGRCSSCGWVAVWQSTDVFGMDYCPHCGARMEVET